MLRFDDRRLVNEVNWLTAPRPPLAGGDCIDNAGVAHRPGRPALSAA